MIKKISDLVGDVNARPFVDSAPVLERSWAEKAGLGWIGKMQDFIVPKRDRFYRRNHHRS